MTIRFHYPREALRHAARTGVEQHGDEFALDVKSRKSADPPGTVTRRLRSEPDPMGVFWPQVRLLHRIHGLIHCRALGRGG